MQTQDTFYPMRASQGQRLGTLLLDLVFVYALAFIIGVVLAAGGMEQVIHETNGYLFGMLLMLIYYVPQEGASGKTLGKRILGTVAVSADGSPVSLGQVFGRTMCRFIPFEAFSCLGGHGYPLGWHDRIPGTQVLVSKKLRSAVAAPVENPGHNTA
jgi:uncharacterized RDD family membrane protein YckC